MMNQHDPTYDIPDDDPARFEATDGDLLDVHLVQEPPDWTSYCDPDPQPMTAQQERALWIRIACAIAAKRDAKEAGK